jgi:hypothetical protein
MIKIFSWDKIVFLVKILKSTPNITVEWLIFLLHIREVKKKVKLSHYTPWRHMGGEEV